MGVSSMAFSSFLKMLILPKVPSWRMKIFCSLVSSSIARKQAMMPRRLRSSANSSSHGIIGRSWRRNRIFSIFSSMGNSSPSTAWESSSAPARMTCRCAMRSNRETLGDFSASSKCGAPR